MMFRKHSAIQTALLPHQQRVLNRLQEQDGLVIAHGLGSGKTLTSIAAAEAAGGGLLGNAPVGGDVAVLIPAALRENFEKEILKHVLGEPEANYHLVSHSKLARDPDAVIRATSPVSRALAIVDEAHRVRNAGSTSDAAKKTLQKFRKRMLLTATPTYNNVGDVAPLINMAAGDRILPESRTDFNARYVGSETVSPTLLQRLRGIKSGQRPVIKNKQELIDIFSKYMDYHANSTEGFPDRIDEVISVPMSDEQTAMYQFGMEKAPAWMREKVRSGLPPSKSESKDLNAFAQAVRQASLSTGGFVQGQTPIESARKSNKIQLAVSKLKDAIAENPSHKALVYSNYLESGLNPYAASLEEEGIPFGRFVGGMTAKERADLVNRYNTNKIKALLVSSAGAEGLDLKGTRAVQVLDPHWNDQKIEQVIGRAIRYKSHDHLPKDQRNVRVERYHATEPKKRLMGLLKDRQLRGIDEYMYNIAQDKSKLNRQIIELMQGNKDY